MILTDILEVDVVEAQVNDAQDVRAAAIRVCADGHPPLEILRPHQLYHLLDVRWVPHVLLGEPHPAVRPIDQSARCIWMLGQVTPGLTSPVIGSAITVMMFRTNITMLRDQGRKRTAAMTTWNRCLSTMTQHSVTSRGPTRSSIAV
jgi:hypothetical protein